MIKILNREILVRGFGLLQRMDVWRKRFDGSEETISRELYDPGDGAAILLYDPTRNRVVLVRQFRLAAYVSAGRETIVEACAGKLEGRDAASRIVMEVEEETGYRIRNPQPLFEAFMSPGVFTEKISFFVAAYSPADKVGPGGGVDHDEDIEVIEPTFDEALAMIKDGTIIDVKTILLLYYAQLFGLLRATGL